MSEAVLINAGTGIAADRKQFPVQGSAALVAPYSGRFFAVMVEPSGEIVGETGEHTLARSDVLFVARPQPLVRRPPRHTTT